MVQFPYMKTSAAAVALLLLLTGCGTPQGPEGAPYTTRDASSEEADRSAPGVQEPSDAAPEAQVYADSGHDAANPADPVNSCFDCPEGQIQECALLCTQIGGYIAGDGYPYQCCHW